MSACSGRNYNFRCINVVFWRVFARVCDKTAAKNRTILSIHRRSCRKPLDRSGPNLTHVCRFICEWTSAKKIKLSSPNGYLEGVRGSHIHTCGKYAKHLDRSGPHLAHVDSMHIDLGMDMSYKKKNTPLIPEGHGGVRGSSFHKYGNASKPLERSGPNLAHI